MECCLQGLFDHRMLKRHAQQVTDGQALLDRPAEQMGEVFAWVKYSS